MAEYTQEDFPSNRACSYYYAPDTMIPCELNGRIQYYIFNGHVVDKNGDPLYED